MAPRQSLDTKTWNTIVWHRNQLLDPKNKYSNRKPLNKERLATLVFSALKENNLHTLFWGLAVLEEDGYAFRPSYVRRMVQNMEQQLFCDEWAQEAVEDISVYGRSPEQMGRYLEILDWARRNGYESSPDWLKSFDKFVLDYAHAHQRLFSLMDSIDDQFLDRVHGFAIELLGNGTNSDYVRAFGLLDEIRQRGREPDVEQIRSIGATLPERNAFKAERIERYISEQLSERTAQ